MVNVIGRIGRKPEVGTYFLAVQLVITRKKILLQVYIEIDCFKLTSNNI